MPRPIGLSTAALATMALTGVTPALLPARSAVPSTAAASPSAPPASGGAPTLVRWGEAPTVRIRWRQNAATGDLMLRNNFAVAIRVTIQASTAEDRDEEPADVQATAQPPSPVLVNAFTTQRVPIRFTSMKGALPIRGFLKLKSVPEAEAAHEATFCATAGNCPTSDLEFAIPVRDSIRPPGTIIVGSLAVALTIAAVAAVCLLAAGIRLCHRMGSATWNFDQSWGANVALASALLAAVLTLVSAPDTLRTMTKDGYVMTQTLLASLLALAPAVYGLFRNDATTQNGVVRQGYVITFLVSGTLVLWAALGQVVTLGLLVQDLGASQFDALTERAFEGVAVLLLVAIAVYGATSLYGTAKHQSQPPPSGPAVPAGAGNAVIPNAPPPLPAPAPAWDML